MNFAFYVSGKAGRLKKILDENNLELLKATKLVFSDDKDTLYLKEKLESLDIKYILCNYNNLNGKNNSEKNENLSDEMLNNFINNNIDYCFCFGKHILKGKLLQIYENKIVNFHPSLLPVFPGINAIDQAIQANAQILGNTAHFVDAGMDTGPIILQSVVSVKKFEKEGYEGVLDIQTEMLYRIFLGLKNKKIYIQNKKVLIEDSNNDRISYFPEF